MIEPFKVKEFARERENENMKFRAFLKNNADCSKLDEQFSELHNELFAGYGCRKCNNCCRAYNATVQESEVTAMAAHLGLTKQDFIEKYLISSVEEYEIKAPCCFLNENGECILQEFKPIGCKDFPYTNKPDRIWSLLGLVSFAEECPVVFEMLERLKTIYKFKSRQ